MTETRPFRIVLPKKGRLKNDFAAALAATELGVVQENERLDFGMLTDRQKPYYLEGNVEVLLQRPADALDCVLNKTADIAVIGLDILTEFNAAAINEGKPRPPIAVIQRLPGISECKLCIAAPRGMKLENESDLSGLRIATSYPETLKAWLKEKGVTNARIVKREGGVEDSVRLGMADVICDMVQTGDTLKLNNLVKKFTVSESVAVTVKRSDTPFSKIGIASLFTNRLQKATAALALQPAA